MRCIFCLEERPPSEEHVFPDALGGVLTTDRSFLGTKVDAPLIDSPHVLMQRWTLKIKGRAGNLPDPLRQFGTGVLAADPTQKIKAKVDSKTGRPDIELIYNKTPLENGTSKVAIDARRAAEIPTIIQRLRAEAQLLPLDEGELKRESEQIISAGFNTLVNPEVIYSFPVADFTSGLLKIAYELAFMWLGEDYIDDPMAAKLREVIIGKADKKITRSCINDGLNPERFGLWANDKTSHIAYNSVMQDDIIINVRIFDVLSAAVVVSEAKHLYIKGQQNPQRVRFVLNDPINKNLRESSLIDECGRIATAALRR